MNFKIGKKINIIIPCGLLNIVDPVEIDRFVRFKLQLESISRINYPLNNIQYTFVEVGEKPRLAETIKKTLPFSKYLFYDKHMFGFNQIVLWNNAIETFPDFDFYVFSHSDILFPKNLHEVLNRRLVDEDKNYYAFRYNFNYKPLTQIATNKSILQTLDETPTTKAEQSSVDYGYKYILDTYKMPFNFKLNYLKFFNLPEMFQIQQEPKWIGESFTCVSKKNFYKLKLQPILSYNNDVAIRDLSVINGIQSEWLNNELIILHMLGLDDSGEFFYKKDRKNFEILPDILGKYPELAHWGLFRFQKDNIPYIKGLDVKFIYNEYIKDKMTLYNQEDFWNFLYKENG
jgi:hypothetical protein